MVQLMVENCASATLEDAVASAPPLPPPPPPLPTAQRRPRVREVSSRFMSPAVSSGDLSHPLATKSPLPKHQQSPTSAQAEIQSKQRSSSVNRRQRQLDLEPLRCSDENRPTEGQGQGQSWETPLPLPPEQMLNYSYSVRKQRPVKPFKENGGGKDQHHHQHQQHLPPKTCTGKGSNAFTTPSRPDTPMVTATLDRTSTSRFRHIQQRPTSTNITATAAAKLLQSSGMPLPGPPANQLTQTEAATSAPKRDPPPPSPLFDVSNHSQIPAALVPSCSTTRCPHVIRSSMPDADFLPTVSCRQPIEKTSSRGKATVTVSGDFLKFSASPCSRSLNLPLSSSDHTFLQPNKGSEKLTSALSKPSTNAGKMGGLCPSPVPPCASAKLGSDIRKGKRVSSHLEDVHSLRVLHNRYLQWRYTNARAEASMRAQQRETGRTLYSLAVKIAELYDSVKRKRMEVGILQRTKTLSTILEAQIPYLDQWLALQGDYSIYLAEATQALLNASAQLPVSGNVRANLREVKEALNSAIGVMEIIVFHVQRSTPKAEETENLISELARVTGGERALIEECGNLLSNTYTTQVEEWSLRGQIIQLKRCCSR